MGHSVVPSKISFKIQHLDPLITDEEEKKKLEKACMAELKEVEFSLKYQNYFAVCLVSVAIFAYHLKKKEWAHEEAHPHNRITLPDTKPRYLSSVCLAKHCRFFDVDCHHKYKH